MCAQPSKLDTQSLFTGRGGGGTGGVGTEGSTYMSLALLADVTVVAMELKLIRLIDVCLYLDGLQCM